MARERVKAKALRPEARPVSPSLAESAPAPALPVRRPGNAIEAIARTATGPAPSSVPAAVTRALASERGEPLPQPNLWSQRIGADVGDARIVVSVAAAEAAAAIQARAFTVGHRVFFAKGNDATTDGGDLLAHELTHVAQQHGASPPPSWHQLPFVADGDTREQAARNHAPLRVGESPMAIARDVGMNPYGGALILADDLHKKSYADQFTGPVTWTVLGDAFEVALARSTERTDELAVDITYRGAYSVDSFRMPWEVKPVRTQRINTRRRPPLDDDRKDLPFNTKLIARTSDALTYDLFGDGMEMLVIKDTVDADSTAKFDRRTHLIGVAVNGFPMDPTWFEVYLPTADAKDGAEAIAACTITLLRDDFTLRARRHGDSSAIVLSIANATQEQQVLVPRPDAKARLVVSVVKNDGRTLEIDLDGDHKPDVTIVHTVRQIPPPALRGHHLYLPGEETYDSRGHLRPEPDPFYTHELAAYDPTGVLLGRMIHKMPGFPGSVPDAQDALKSPAPAGAAQPATKPPQQGDVFGEAPQAIQSGGRDWELRVDGDGDRTKELLLRFIPTGPDRYGEPQELTLRVTQISSGLSGELRFILAAEPAGWLSSFGPRVVTAPDGHTLGTIDLGRGTILEYGRNNDAGTSAGYIRYDFRLGGSVMAFVMPFDKTPSTTLLQQDAGATGAVPTKRVADALTADIQLTEYRDRFRVSVQSVGFDEVLFGVTPVQDGVQIGGIHTRLLDVHQLRLDEFSLMPDRASFLVKDGMNPVNISSALDPPKDPDGRPIVGVPPISHRDHRITVWGLNVLGNVTQTFPIRFGKFVPIGWKKDDDAQLVEGAAEAVDVLPEQAKHPQLAEFRAQLDASLDAAIKNAVEKNYIDARSADSWMALKAAMVLISSQAGAGSNPDADQVTTAINSVKQVDHWLEWETNTDPKASFSQVAVTSRRRAAPDEPGPYMKWSGTGRNDYTGALFEVQDSIIQFDREKDNSTTFGRQLEKFLQVKMWQPAADMYATFREGVRRWIKIRYERDAKEGEVSAGAAQLDYIGKIGSELADLDKIQAERVKLDASIDAEVDTAAKKGLISAELGKVWAALREGMIAITAQTGGEALDKTAAAVCVTNALALSAWLATETSNQVGQLGNRRMNAFTGESQLMDASGTWAVESASYGQQVASYINQNKPLPAGRAYNRLRDGIVRWLAQKYQTDPDHKDPLAAARLGGLQKERAGKRDVMRIAAMYQADDSYAEMPDRDGYKQADFGKYKTLPLTLFVWADDGKWYIRDLTNPDKIWPGHVDFNDEDQPPEALFKQLDSEAHWAKGYLYYQLADGSSNRIRIESEKEWYDYVREVALVIGMIALVAATAGAALGALAVTVPVFLVATAEVAGTVSAVLSVTADVGEIVHASRAGYLDDNILFADVMDIAINLATLGAGGAGKLKMGAQAAAQAEKAGEGVAWQGLKAFAGRTGEMLYRPLMALSIAGNVYNAVVMTEEMVKALAATDSIKDPWTRLKARAQLLATWAASSTMIVLSLHGDLPNFFKGSPTIVLDNVNGRTVARIADASLGKTPIEVPMTNADAFASARWSAAEVEQTAKTGSGAAKSEATAALGDEKFRDWYADWLKNPQRVDERGILRPLPADTPLGYAERAQALVDQGDAGIYKQAFDTAEKVRATGLDIDPQGADWKTNRAKLEQELAKTMGEQRARTAVSRYEAARLGGKGNVVDFATQRAQVGKVLPETEVNRITQLFAGNEVHVTGDITSPQGGAGKGTSAVEVVVVMPNDTSPEVMSAMEQRTRGYKVLPDPEFTKTTGSETLELRAKVMTEDQFLGMATASRKGKVAPRYVRLDQPVRGVIDVGVPVHEQSLTHYSVEPATIEAARANMAGNQAEGRVGKLRYDPSTNSAYFEVYGTKVGSTVRVEAPLPGRITGAADWGNSNRILGTHVFEDAQSASAALRRVHGGDLASLGETVGVHPPADAATTAAGVEFGVGQLPDGRYVIVKGNVGEIDWAELPGVTGRMHTHPDFEGTNLSPDMHGVQRQVPLVEVERPPAPGEPPSLDAAKIQPSGADVVYAAQHSGGHQGVLTPFVVQDGMVYKPGFGPALHEGVPPDARLEYEITKAVEIGTLGEDGPVVVRAELEATFNGKPVSRKTVWATAATPTEKAGLVHLTEPEGVVAKAPVGAAKEVAPPVKPDLPSVQIDAIKTKLTTAVNDQMAAQKLPVDATPEVRVLQAADFESQFSSERGRAVFQLEGDKGVIYAHPEARKLDIAGEMEHVRQMQDPTLATEVRVLHGGALGDQWKGLSATEKIGQYRRKLDLEIDATEHLLGKQPAGSPEHAEVGQMLKDLYGLRDEVDALTPEDLTALNAGVKPLPQYLEDPPWLFSKNRDKSARPSRPVNVEQKDLVQLPSGKATVEEQSARSTQYNDEDVDKVSQVGKSWKEHDDLHSGYNGKVTKRTGKGGKKFLVVTNESGVEHLYAYSDDKVLDPKFAKAPDEPIPTGQSSAVEIEAGEKFGEEPAREYRWVEVEYKDGRPPKLVEEIKSLDDKLGWRERGAAKTERGDILENAAIAQEDARLGPRLDDQGNVKYAHLPSQEGRAGFDDIIVEFGGTREKPTAKLRVREMKDYPNKTVPFGEFSAITDNLKANWEDLGEKITEAMTAFATKEPMPEGFENMTKEQLLALRDAYDAKRVKVEIVLGPGTKANPVGRKAGVHEQLKAKIEERLGKGALVDTPTRVDDDYVRAEIEKNADKPPTKLPDDE